MAVRRETNSVSEIHVVGRRRYYARFTATTGIFVACTPIVWFGSSNDPAARVVSIVGLVFFGAGFLTFFAQLARPRRLDIDAHGFTLRGLGGWRAPWEAVRSVTSFETAGARRRSPSSSFMFEIDPQVTWRPPRGLWGMFHRRWDAGLSASPGARCGAGEWGIPATEVLAVVVAHLPDHPIDCGQRGWPRVPT